MIAMEITRVGKDSKDVVTRYNIVEICALVREYHFLPCLSIILYTSLRKYDVNVLRKLETKDRLQPGEEKIIIPRNGVRDRGSFSILFIFSVSHIRNL